MIKIRNLKDQKKILHEFSSGLEVDIIARQGKLMQKWNADITLYDQYRSFAVYTD